MHPFRPLFLLLALLFTACTTPAPAQQALKVDPDTGQLIEPTTLQIGANQTFTVANNATITLPAASLPISATAGLQAALDVRPTFTTANATFASLSGAAFTGPVTVEGNVVLDATSNIDQNQVQDLVDNLASKAPLNSPVFTSGIQAVGDLTLTSGFGNVSIVNDEGSLSFNGRFAWDFSGAGPYASGFNFAAFTGPNYYTLPNASGTLALTSDLAAYVPTTRTVNGSPLSSNVTISTITGNAGTATALQTARTINGVSFNGTANITVTAAGSTLTDAVPASLGGTGRTTLTAGNLLTGTGTGPLTLIAPGTSGNVLTSNGTAWLSAAPSGGGGNITINTTAPLTVNGGNSSTTSNATLALSLATPAQAVAGASTTLPIPPASLLLAQLNTGLRLYTFTTGTSVATGSGTGELDAGICFRLQTSNATAGTRVRRNGVTNGIYAMANIGTSQIGINWGKPWGASARFMPSQTWASGNRALICIQKDRTQGFGLAGTAAFFFIEVDNLVLKVGYWNGTAATRTSTLATLVANQVAEIIMLGDGAGNLTIYLNGSSAATLSSIPTTSEQSIEACINIEMENTGTGNTAWFNVAYPVRFWSYN